MATSVGDVPRGAFHAGRPTRGVPRGAPLESLFRTSSAAKTGTRYPELDFWALQDVNFEVKGGEAGKNVYLYQIIFGKRKNGLF
jgi:hypothetical protein